MLELKYLTASPLIRDKTRLFALSSGSEYGKNTLHDEHLMEHLNNFIGNLGNEKILENYDSLRHREPVDPRRKRVLGNHKMNSDIMLKDTFRQHKAISEIYRRSLCGLEDFRRISEPSTKFHHSISRGYERELINHFTLLDSEMLNRKSIRPVI